MEPEAGLLSCVELDVPPKTLAAIDLGSPETEDSLNYTLEIRATLYAVAGFELRKYMQV